MKLILALLLSAFSVIASAQEISYAQDNLPPISDIGLKKFKGFSGGLYPGGKNSRPVDHNEIGLKIAGEISPVDQPVIV